MNKIIIGILKGFTDRYKQYVSSCNELGIEYKIIEFVKSNWLKDVEYSVCDGFLCEPPCEFQEWKSIYDERLYILNKIMNKMIYPSFNELYLYENKRLLSYWLDYFNYPHPETKVFCNKTEYINYIMDKTNYPFVFKTNIGAAASGVRIIKKLSTAKKYIKPIFGLTNPHLAIGDLKLIKGKRFTFPSFGSMQKHYIIAQKFEEIKWEWRIIKIGDSYFGHQKLLHGNFASGSNRVGWVDPPKEILLLAKDICEKGHFYSMAVDIFETKDGRFLINELQSIFGSYGKPGRYIFNDDKFIFEEGYFNTFGSYLLRVKHFLKLISERKENDEDWNY